MSLEVAMLSSLVSVSSLVLGLITCVGCDIVKGDHAPDCGVAQSFMESSSGTMAGIRKRWERNLRRR